jgi:hypothetical protein
MGNQQVGQQTFCNVGRIGWLGSYLFRHRSIKYFQYIVGGQTLLR